MIGKKIPNPKASASKAGRVGGLSDYILCQGEPDKLLCAGSRGFISQTEAGHVAEMIALSTDATRSRDPVSHYVLSWREHERPSAAQIEQAIDIFANETGLTGHQMIYGLHTDTDNLHLHIAVNRAVPETARVVKINGGFDIEAIHRVVARIEAEQGWEREANARYTLDPSGQLSKTHRDGAARTPSTQAQDFEARTGTKSAERIAQADAAPVIQQAQSWEELHAGLASCSMRYERKGSGAVVWIGEQAVKASSVDRRAAIGKLEARLGPFQAAGQSVEMRPRSPEPMPAGRPEWDAYSRERRTLQTAKSDAWTGLRERQTDERKTLAADQATERRDALAGDWRGKGMLLNGLRSQLAAKHAAAKADRKDAHDKQRLALRGQFPAVHDFDTWRRQQGHERPVAGTLHGADAEASRSRPEPQDIRAFVGRQDGYRVAYVRKDHQTGAVAFVDQGRQIKVYTSEDAGVLAALQLADQRFGRSAGLLIDGSEDFKRRCVGIAARHGIKISNPALQDAIKAEREQHQARERERQAQVERPQTEPGNERQAERHAADASHDDAKQEQENDLGR